MTEVYYMLRRKGVDIDSANPRGSLVFPPDWDEGFEDELYVMLK